MTVGDASWGQIKLGRDLGVYESDAILSDMTLLGVGTPAGGGNTTLGRIGFGYLYADWKTQIQYSTPNWNGFQVTVALDTPWEASNAAGLHLNNNSKDMGFEGKATYDFACNDVTGRVWVGGISQKVNGSVTTETNSASVASSFTASGYDVGAKVGMAGAELVASYYSGEGIGITGFLLSELMLTVQKLSQTVTMFKVHTSCQALVLS
jgi:predicted porin